MEEINSTHTKAVLQALLVTALWSFSWILIKFTITEIPPLIFAGLRYSIASLILLPGLFKNKGTIQKLSKSDWWLLILLGIVFYAFTQGSQFITLQYLETTTFSLLLNFSAVIITLLGIIFLNEKPTWLQWAGMVVFFGGVLLYFSPTPLGGGSWRGYLFAGITVLSTSIGSLLGRQINRSGTIPAAVTTGISMSIGAVLLLTAGLIFEDFPPLSITNWLVILCLALINTAFAFTLWNKSLQVLSAMESGIINNSMLVQIALLSIIFLGDRLSIQAWLSLLVATVGIVMTSLQKNTINSKTGTHNR